MVSSCNIISFRKKTKKYNHFSNTILLHWGNPWLAQVWASSQQHTYQKASNQSCLFKRTQANWIRALQKQTRTMHMCKIWGGKQNAPQSQVKHWIIRLHLVKWKQLFWAFVTLLPAKLFPFLLRNTATLPKKGGNSPYLVFYLWASTKKKRNRHQNYQYTIMASEPTPPNVPPPPEKRPYLGLINHWFPLIRPD